jgi:excisionase family DNA binding protein
MHTTAQPADFMSIREFAARMDWSTTTVRRRIADGTVPAVKIAGTWRVPAVALERALERADTQRAERAARATDNDHEEP